MNTTRFLCQIASYMSFSSLFSPHARQTLNKTQNNKTEKWDSYGGGYTYRTSLAKKRRGRQKNKRNKRRKQNDDGWGIYLKKKNFEGRKRLRFARTMTMERRDVRLRGGGEMLLFCGVGWVCGGFSPVLRGGLLVAWVWSCLDRLRDVVEREEERVYDSTLVWWTILDNQHLLSQRGFWGRGTSPSKVEKWGESNVSVC